MEQQEMKLPYEQALWEIRALAQFELDHPTSMHQTMLSIIINKCNEALNGRDERNTGLSSESEVQTLKSQTPKARKKRKAKKKVAKPTDATPPL